MDQFSTTDKSLVFRLRSGDEDAAAELYHRYASRVFGLVRSQMADYLKAQVEPEDIVQSVFRSVFRGVESAGYDAPAGGTLWQLIAVLAVNKVRRNARRRVAAKRNLLRTESLEELESHEPSFASPQILECAVREAIAELTLQEQEVVLLRIQSYTVEEISTRIGKSRRTTERLLQSAKEELAKMLALE